MEARNVQVPFIKKPQMNINSLNKQKHGFHNPYFVRHGLQWYRCKSSIAIFAWRVTWNYAYSTFRLRKYSQITQFFTHPWLYSVLSLPLRYSNLKLIEYYKYLKCQIYNITSLNNNKIFVHLFRCFFEIWTFQTIKLFFLNVNMKLQIVSKIFRNF